MDEITLEQLIPGATQDINTVTLPKSALTGLVPAAVNRADQIAAAFANRCVIVYPPTLRNGNPDATPPVAGKPDVSIIAQFGTRSIATNFETGDEFQQQTITLDFYKLLPSPTFVANDY